MNKSANILIVDDEPDTAEILSRQLGIENYKVLKAYSGKESLELLKKHKLDLILMDLMMPEMDGFETIRIIRDTVKEFIPIIIVTATKDVTESITRGFTVGANDYIVIPCHKEELLARIKAMLRIKELHDLLGVRNQKLTEAYEKITENNGKLQKLAVMGRLVAEVSHEINNPLAIIIGGTQVVLSHLDKKPSLFKIKSQLETVLRNARRCKNIIANMLNYNRTISKKEEAINLSTLIREAIEDVSYQYDMSGIETVLNCNEIANAKITGNSTALLSVFINLIRNARQAMGEKGHLTITMQKEDKKYLRIEIHDTGSGISDKQKAELFKPFVSGWKERDGSGLGLATSLGIIEMHDGSMSAESGGVGKGAIFTILLPYGLKGNK